MIDVKILAVEKKDAGTVNAGTRNGNTEAYVPKDIAVETLRIGDAYLCYDKEVNALKVYGANNGAMNLYALGGVSALGQSSVQGGGGGTSYNRLDSWEAYDASKTDWVLSALLGNDLNSRVTSLENGQIEGVATQEWVQKQGYLTELSAATINALGAIKIGYSVNGKNYPVLLDNNNRAYVSVPWNDTWRPLGTGATDACAGNDARLSDARPASDVYAWAKASTKPTYTLDEVADGSSRKLSDYLPLTGGTISRRGTSYPLRINNPTGQNVRLVLELAEVIKGSIAYNDSRGTYIAVGDVSSSIYMGIKTDGTPYVVNDSVTENVIWHAGNDGANSGLDADLLDGQHGAYYAKAVDVATLQGYFTNGVAKSAVKLATARTIWGQSFDGSANVSGAMTGVTNVDGLLYFDTTTGFVKISSSSPSPLVLNSTSTYNYLYFRVNDSNKANIGWYNDNLGLVMQCGSNFISLASTGDFKLKTSLGLLCMDVVGNVGIGTTSPNYKLDVAGVIHSSVGMFSDGYVSALGQNTSSDERLKDVQGDINVSIDVLAGAPSKVFEWRSNRALGEQAGTIAQYWQRALPQVVHDRGDGYLSMQYDVAALIGVISVAKEVKNHEERIKELEQENEALREQLKELKG